MHGILEGETTLELSELHPELLPMLPLAPSVYEAGTIDAARVAVDLHLQFEGEVTQATIDIQTDETDRKVGFDIGVFARGATDFADGISAEGRVLLELLAYGLADCVEADAETGQN